MRSDVRGRARRKLAGACACDFVKGCGCALPGGATSCPSFVPAALVTGLQSNKTGVDILVAALHTVGATLSGSIVLAPLGVPVSACAVVLSILASGCDGAGALQAQARAASYGAKATAMVAGLGSIATLISLIGAPAAPVLAGIAAAATALVPVLDALGAGRAPTASDATRAVSAVASMANFRLPQIDAAGLAVDKAVAALGTPALKSQAATLTTLAKSVPSTAKSTSLVAPSMSAAAVAKRKAHVAAFVRATVAAPTGPYPTFDMLPGMMRILFIKRVSAAKATTAAQVAAVWRASPPAELSAAELAAALATSTAAPAPIKGGAVSRIDGLGSLTKSTSTTLAPVAAKQAETLERIAKAADVQAGRGWSTGAKVGAAVVFGAAGFGIYRAVRARGKK